METTPSRPIRNPVLLRNQLPSGWIYANIPLSTSSTRAGAARGCASCEVLTVTACSCAHSGGREHRRFEQAIHAVLYVVHHLLARDNPVFEGSDTLHIEAHALAHLGPPMQVN